MLLEGTSLNQLGWEPDLLFFFFNGWSSVNVGHQIFRRYIWHILWLQCSSTEEEAEVQRWRTLPCVFFRQDWTKKPQIIVYCGNSAFPRWNLSNMKSDPGLDAHNHDRWLGWFLVQRCTDSAKSTYLRADKFYPTVSDLRGGWQLMQLWSFYVKIHYCYLDSKASFCINWWPKNW